MTNQQLQRITFAFPSAAASEQKFFEAFSALIAAVPNVIQTDDRLVITPIAPHDALPTTWFERADVAFPHIAFDTTWKPIDLRIGRLQLRSNSVAIAAHDSVERRDPPAVPRLSMIEIEERLRGHITRIDHTGVNLPIALVDRSQWNMLIRTLAETAAVYRYPTGEEWPFIVPATDGEFQHNITRFVAGREPKFELVYDQWAQHPVLQFSIETDLVRSELEAMFPDPYGEAFPDLGDIFRTVYVTHPWPDLLIRFDLNYRSNGIPSVWDTAEWLVTEGGRIDPNQLPT